MNREETKELIKVMQHYAAGGDVEFKAHASSPLLWKKTEYPHWGSLNADYRIAKSPADREIMDAWEADHDCLEVSIHGAGRWKDRFMDRNSAPDLKAHAYRIKSKYTPEQQLIVDAHERGESIDCVLLNTQMERAWGRISVRAVLNFRDFAYRLTPVVIVTYKSTGHGAEVKGKIREAEKGSEYDKAIICAPHLWKWEGERTL